MQNPFRRRVQYLPMVIHHGAKTVSVGNDWVVFFVQPELADGVTTLLGRAMNESDNIPLSPCRAMARPRMYASNAEKQRAYRARKRGERWIT